jgi:hypothetical protein
MQNITVNDQARKYDISKNSSFDAEVKTGKATAFSAPLTPSTNVPEEGTSEMLRKTTGGSGTLAGSSKIRDQFAATETKPIQIYVGGIHCTMPIDGDITHLGDVLAALVTDLTANGCYKLERMLNGVHDPVAFGA